MSEPEKHDHEESEQKKIIDFDDDKEPIESIEKTVEDLKRKIQELSGEADPDMQEEQSNNEDHDTAKEKIAETFDSAAKTISSGFNDLKDKAVEAAKSEEMKKSIAYIKANAVKAMSAAKDKFNQLKNDPNIQAAGNKAADSIEKFAGAAKDKGQDLYDHLDDQTKSNIENVCGKVEQAVSSSAKAVDEFFQRPDVQEKIAEVKTTTAELVQKGEEKVKELFDHTEK